MNQGTWKVFATGALAGALIAGAAAGLVARRVREPAATQAHKEWPVMSAEECAETGRDAEVLLSVTKDCQVGRILEWAREQDPNTRYLLGVGVLASWRQDTYGETHLQAMGSMFALTTYERLPWKHYWERPTPALRSAVTASTSDGGTP